MKPHATCVFCCAAALAVAAPYAGAATQESPIDDAAMQSYDAHAVAVTGAVSRIRDAQPWAVSAGERVPVRQTITTGRDGYARFEVRGGSSFELFSNSRVVFRQNTASAGDLLDVLAGRVKVHLQPTLEQNQQRVFCPTAIITARRQPATLAVAIDEDGSLRIDVLEGEVAVQHALLPHNEPTLVRAVDAILVKPDEPISRRVDRGSLYKYAVKIFTALTPGHSHSDQVLEDEPFLADASSRAPGHVPGLR